MARFVAHLPRVLFLLCILPLVSSFLTRPTKIPSEDLNNTTESTKIDNELPNGDVRLNGLNRPNRRLRTDGFFQSNSNSQFRSPSGNFQHSQQQSYRYNHRNPFRKNSALSHQYGVYYEIRGHYRPFYRPRNNGVPRRPRLSSDYNRPKNIESPRATEEGDEREIVEGDEFVSVEGRNSETTTNVTESSANTGNAMEPSVSNVQPSTNETENMAAAQADEDDENKNDTSFLIIRGTGDDQSPTPLSEVADRDITPPALVNSSEEDVAETNSDLPTTPIPSILTTTVEPATTIDLSVDGEDSQRSIEFPEFQEEQNSGSSEEESFGSSEEQSEEQSSESSEEQSEEQTFENSEEQSSESSEEQSEEQTFGNSEEQSEEQSSESSEEQTFGREEEQSEERSSGSSEEQTFGREEEQSEEQNFGSSEEESREQILGSSEEQTEEESLGGSENEIASTIFPDLPTTVDPLSSLSQDNKKLLVRLVRLLNLDSNSWKR